jgi:hypothetical protein
MTATLLRAGCTAIEIACIPDDSRGTKYVIGFEFPVDGNYMKRVFCLEDKNVVFYEPKESPYGRGKFFCITILDSSDFGVPVGTYDFEVLSFPQPSSSP